MRKPDHAVHMTHCEVGCCKYGEPDCPRGAGVAWATVTARWNNLEARSWPWGLLSEGAIRDLLRKGHVLTLRLANDQLVRVTAK